MKSEILYKENLNWLHEVQLFRKGLSQVKAALSESMHLNNIDKKGEKINTLLNDIHQVNQKLSNTEEKILESLNNGTMYWRGPHENLFCSNSKLIEENELLDLMKNNYNLLIEVQRSINQFLSEQELS